VLVATEFRHDPKKLRRFRFLHNLDRRGTRLSIGSLDRGRPEPIPPNFLRKHLFEDLRHDTVKVSI
jgi:hypothetical protein